MNLCSFVKTHTRYLIAGVAFSLFFASSVFAFNPPTTAPGSGGGLLYVDSNGNLGINVQTVVGGTTAATPPGGSYSSVFMIAASSTPPGFALRNIASGLGGDTTGFSLSPATYVWKLTPWGGMVFFDANPTPVGDPNRLVIFPNGRVLIGGFGGSYVQPNTALQVKGDVTASTFSGNVSAANVSSGAFGSLQGNGNFAFPASLAVGTSTTAGLPTGVLSMATSLGNTWGMYLRSHIGTAVSKWEVAGSETNHAVTFGAVSNNNLSLITAGLTRMTIQNDGNVGIGTAGPTALLDVQGSISGQSAIKIKNTNTGGYSGTDIYNEGGVLGASIWLAGSTTGVNPNALTIASRISGQPIYLVAGGYDPAVSGGVTIKAGNVGIGTTTPGQKLSVVGVVESTTGGFKFPDGTIQTTAGGGSSVGWSRTGTNVYLSTSTDSVGIGTASPGSKLTVAGAGQFTGFANPSSGLGVEIGHDGVEGVLQSYNRTTPGWSPLWINGSNVILQNSSGGNVGIGTTGPGVKLDVNNGGGSDTVVARVTRDYANATTGSRGGEIDFIPATTGSATPGSKITTNYWGAASEGRLSFYAYNQANQLVLHEGGNVGIGTAIPGYKLDVSGTGNFTQPVIVGTPVASNHAATKSYVDSAVAGGSGSTVGYWTLSGSNLYTSNTSYNVGIGTTNPSTKLDVSGYLRAGNRGTNINSVIIDAAAGLFPVGASAEWATPFIYRSMRNPDVGSGAFPWNNFGELILQGTSYGDSYNRGISFVTTPNDLTTPAIRMRVDPSGNVGIGTTGPNYKLDIQGASGLRLGNGAYDANVVFGNTPAWQSGIRVYDNGQAEMRIWTNQPTGEIVLTNGYSGDQSATLPTDGLWVKNNNVGIGNFSVTAPGYKLDIQGAGNFTQPVIVGTPTASNHAATKSYVDSAITTSGYLPLSGGTMTGNINMNNNNILGVAKLTVGIIDPLYEIGGNKYSTYGSDVIGIKVEYFGKMRITQEYKTKEYRRILDLGNQEEGSDLWVFWQTINEGKNMEDIVVSATPEGSDARVWYDLNPKKKQIYFYSSKPVTLSYHLVAPRHDSNIWKTKTDTEEKGIILRVKK